MLSHRWGFGLGVLLFGMSLGWISGPPPPGQSLTGALLVILALTIVSALCGAASAVLMRRSR